MYTQGDLQGLYDIWTGSQYPDCIRAQAQTYISILSDPCIMLANDGIDIEEDTMGRALWFVELVANGDSHVWYEIIHNGQKLRGI